MSEEEIIKTINVNLDKIKSLCTDDCINKTVVIVPLEYAIKGLLDLYNKEKEKNRILEDLLQGKLYELYLYYKELAGSYQANSISKDKIREKIKELTELTIDPQCGKNIFYKIEVLKSLLEE